MNKHHVPFVILIVNVMLHIEVFCGDEKLLFQKFVERYNKSYGNSTDEYQERSAIFVKNLKDGMLQSRNRTHKIDAVFGITKFSDLTPEEFKSQYLSDYIPSKATPYHLDTLVLPHHWPSNSGQLPQKVDWRKKNVITAVKNQRSCGGCWAFSTVECLETEYALKTGKPKSLSVQQVLDCSLHYKNILSGCFGGQPCAALSWLNMTKTILQEESQYPLKDYNQYCKLVPQSSSGVRVKGFKCINFEGHESELLRHIATVGPVSVAVDASNWMNYQGGVIQYHCPQRLNHAVQVVGYDLTGEVPFYIVRNSWGKDWGHSGYLYLRYGNNICGVASETSWPIDIEVV